MRYPFWDADVAQLVEHQLPKLRVAGSNPVVRFAKLAGKRHVSYRLEAIGEFWATVEHVHQLQDCAQQLAYPEGSAAV